MIPEVKLTCLYLYEVTFIKNITTVNIPQNTYLTLLFCRLTRVISGLD